MHLPHFGRLASQPCRMPYEPQGEFNEQNSLCYDWSMLQSSCIADANCSHRETHVAFVAAIGCSVNRALSGESGTRIHPGGAGFRTSGYIGSGGGTLFQNVRIFDGKSAALSAPSNVLVRGSTIERISPPRLPLTLTLTSALLRRAVGC